MGVIKKMEVLKNINLEFYMFTLIFLGIKAIFDRDTKITDKILEDVVSLQDLPKIEEILINFTKFI